MQFDKSRVYTALNAEELPIGSICVFADTIRGLRRKIEEGKDIIRVETFTCLHGDGEGCGDIQFSDGFYTYNYAYLIEPPAEPKYKPFSSEEKAIGIIEQHECWIKSKMTQNCFLVGIKDSKHIPLIGYDCKEFFSLLLDGYVFADDDTPCGELVEE